MKLSGHLNRNIKWNVRQPEAFCRKKAYYSFRFASIICQNGDVKDRTGFGALWNLAKTDYRIQLLMTNELEKCFWIQWETLYLHFKLALTVDKAKCLATMSNHISLNVPEEESEASFVTSIANTFTIGKRKECLVLFMSSDGCLVTKQESNMKQLNKILIPVQVIFDVDR